jgi:hypothetical protein
MTDRNGAESTNGTWLGGGMNSGPGGDEGPSDVDLARSEYQLWQVYDAGGPALILKVRYCDGLEVQDWRRGPDLATALRKAEAQGWHAFDSEPGNAIDEHSIIHLSRIAAR